MKLKKGTIKHLQNYVIYKVKERGFEDETVHETLLLLAEEVGELIKAVRKTSGMYVDQNKEITYKTGSEMTDVINMVFALANKLNIDVETEFVKKEDENDKRVYKRSKDK